MCLTCACMDAHLEMGDVNITYEDIKRAAKVTIKALDRKGVPFQLDADGLLAVAVQHEIDHLDGVLMIDRMGILKKRIVQRKMQKRAAELA